MSDAHTLSGSLTVVVRPSRCNLVANKYILQQRCKGADLGLSRRYLRLGREHLHFCRIHVCLGGAIRILRTNQVLDGDNPMVIEVLLAVQIVRGLICLSLRGSLICLVLIERRLQTFDPRNLLLDACLRSSCLCLWYCPTQPVSVLAGHRNPGNQSRRSDPLFSATGCRQ
jgi:hypothetical protein